MDKLLKYVGVVALVIAIIATFTPTGKTITESLGNKTASFWDAADGYKVDGTTVIDGSGNVDAPITSTTGTFSGILNPEGGLVEGGRLSISTTSATYTLTADELDNVKYIEIAANVASAAITISLPATSTMTALLPTAGDCQEWIIDNLHTAAATTSTFAAGTGWDIDGTTANDDVINGGVSGVLKACRLADTNVRAIMEEMVDAG